MKKFLILFLIIFGILSCTKKIETLKTSVVEVARPTLDISLPDPVNLEKIEWHIIVNNDKKYVGITIEDYKKLSINMEKIQSFILKQKDIIKEQKKYYENRKDRVHRNTTG